MNRPRRSAKIGAKISASIAAAMVCAPLLSAPAAAAEECHTALILALDASDSVDPREADLQRSGIAAALRDPEIRAALAPAEGVGAMVTVFEWADPGETQVLAPWAFLDGPAAIDAFAARLTRQPSVYMAGQTGVGAALEFAAKSFRGAGRRCGRRVIDVSGDGAGNIGATPDLYRGMGLFDGITINGLVIRNPAFDSAQPPGRDPLPYYETQVRHGPGAFVMTVRTYDDYASGIRRKLLRELSPALAARQ